MLSKEGHIQLIDFGAAQFVKDVKDLHLAVGTLEYLAPGTFPSLPSPIIPNNSNAPAEVVKMKKHEKEADWWALGILLYEMLTGYIYLPKTLSLKTNSFYFNRKLPFTSPLQSEIPALITACKYDLPPHLADSAKSLIKGLLTKKPSKRLGCGKKGAEAIKQHPFFAGIDWATHLQSTPPISIQLDNDSDTKYFFE
jgi:ribosomal protein S6 kinase beta